MTWLIKQVKETSFSTVWRFKDPIAIYKEYITVVNIVWILGCRRMINMWML